MNAPGSIPGFTPSPATGHTTQQDHPHAGTVQRASTKRALVLGGGGSTGNAWLIGIIAGLFDAGIDVTKADLVVGTSAGSTAAAQLAGATPAELLSAVLAGPPQRRDGPDGRIGPVVPDAGGGTSGRAAASMERTGRIIAAARDAADMRRGMGAAALELDASSEDSMQRRWRATVASRLPSLLWPEQRVLITAVDARTGDPVTFDRSSGVDLVDAVAASCSSGFAYRVGDNYYIDGGYRRNENADLAAGYGRVLVLSPLGGKTRMPLAWNMQLAAQVDVLRASGSKVETMMPESSTGHLFGVNAMDLSLRPSAARAGYNQAGALAAQIEEFWR